MSLVKSRQATDITVKIPKSLREEIDRYSTWADVSMDDIVSQAVEMLFERDQKWVDENTTQTPGITLKKNEFVRQVYAEIVSGKHPAINELAGKVSSGSVFKIIKENYKREDIAYGTCTSQTSYCNRLIKNQNDERKNAPDYWECLSERIKKLGGVIPSIV